MFFFVLGKLSKALLIPISVGARHSWKSCYNNVDVEHIWTMIDRVHRYSEHGSDQTVV